MHMGSSEVVSSTPAYCQCFCKLQAPNQMNENFVTKDLMGASASEMVMQVSYPSRLSGGRWKQGCLTRLHTT